jgi:Protein kinase domain/Domain of unknown function (DUF4384)
MNIPDHTVIRRLGQGGFGEVWLAKHDRLQREHAVKCLRADRFTADGLDRLEQEAQFMSRLPKHRNRVQVFDLRRTPDGVFLMMEYVDGESLHNRLLPWDRAVRYVSDVADGLAGVHASGILHRDIKPANVLWARQPDETLLTDFGLAARAAEAASLAGTPGYVAPEVASAPSAKSDVFSLAATLYALVAGSAPYTTSSLNRSVDEARQGPQLRHSRGLGVVPRALEQTLLAGLEPDPDRRPALDNFVARLRGAHNQALADRLLELSRRAGGSVKLDLNVMTAPAPEGPWQRIVCTPQRVERTRDMEFVPEPAPVAAVRTGHLLRLEMTADGDGYFTVLNLGSSGKLTVVFPNPVAADNRAVANQTQAVTLRLTPPAGTDRAAVVWTRRPNSLNPAEWRERIEAGKLATAESSGATRGLEFLLHEARVQAADEWCANVVTIDHQAPPA